LRVLKKPQNRVNFPWKKNIQREEKEKEKGLFYFTMAFFWSKNRWKANNVTKIFSQWLWLPANQSNVENKKQKEKNELFWLIILSTTLSDFGDNFGIERWNEKKKITHTTTLRYFEWKKNNTYEHYALKNNDGFFLYYYYYTYTMLSSKKKWNAMCLFNFCEK